MRQGYRLRMSGLGMRRGMAAVLFAVLLPVFVGFVALSLDLGMVALARNQLGTAADAGALAGAIKLATENRVRASLNLSSEIAAANTQAAALAKANAVLKATPVVIENPTNTSSGDIRVGYLDPTNYTSTLVTDSSATLLFNSVQVTMKRDATHVGPVPNLFGNLMGFNGSNVTMKSTATAVAYSIAGVKSIDGQTNVNFLPIVLDEDTYASMMSNETMDLYTYNVENDSVTSGSDGIDESRLYPVKNGFPGNWGTIKVGVSNNSTSTLGAQIRYGITPSQLATFPNSKIALDYSKTPPQITFEGNPGISAGIKDDLESIIGKPVVIPIYKPSLSGGNGNNAYYGVTKFQAVRILDVNFQGNPKYVIIQPCLTTDPSIIPGSAQTGWTAGGYVKVHLSR